MFPLSLVLLALPLIEIAGFVIVGKQIGVVATIGLVVLSSVIGGILLRIQGIGILAQIGKQIEAGQNPSREVAHGVMVVMAGILLLIPGFVTDLLGILLFIPPVRDLGWHLIKDHITVRGGFVPNDWRSARSDRSKTIELDEDEYTKDPNPASPWRRLDKE